jgi:hypothetical protein
MNPHPVRDYGVAGSHRTRDAFYFHNTHAARIGRAGLGVITKRRNPDPSFLCGLKDGHFVRNLHFNVIDSYLRHFPVLFVERNDDALSCLFLIVGEP